MEERWPAIRQLVNELLNQKSMPGLAEAWLQALKRADYITALGAAQQIEAYTMLRLIFTNQDEVTLGHFRQDLMTTAKQTGWPDQASVWTMMELLAGPQQSLAS